MNRFTNAVLIAVSLGLPAFVWGQTGTQARVNANSQVSVQANQSHAQASGGTSAGASAQSTPANAGLASGSAFNARLDSSLDSRKKKPGDRITARTTEGVKSEGMTILPKGTKLIGHVTHSSARAQGDAESALAITFDHAVLKNGHEVPLDVAIRAIASSQSAASAGEAGADTTSFMDTGIAGSTMVAGRGAVGGLTSTAGGAFGTVARTSGALSGVGDAALTATAESAAGVTSTSHGAVGGLNAAGQLASNSRGVFGLNGLSLGSATATGAEGSVITSAGKDVRLDSGTKMLLVTQTRAGVVPTH